MGERKCAFEGCNALEFRTSGYCLRHKEEASRGDAGKDDHPPESISSGRTPGPSVSGVSGLPDRTKAAI